MTGSSNEEIEDLKTKKEFSFLFGCSFGFWMVIILIILLFLVKAKPIYIYIDLGFCFIALFSIIRGFYFWFLQIRRQKNIEYENKRNETIKR